MSTIKRILVGSAGNWIGIVIIFIQRLLITPIVLSTWNAEQYGFYLVLAALIGLITLPGRSYENVINRELLRIGGKFTQKLIGLYGGAIVVAAALEFTLAVVIFVILTFATILDPEATKLISGNEILLVSSLLISRVINSFPGSTFSGLLSCYGYLPKLIWLGLIGRLLAVIIPCAGALSGLGPVGVTVLDLTAPCVFTVPAWIVLRKWAIREKVWSWAPDFDAAFRILVLSFQNLITEVVMMVRGEGIRVVLSAFAGSVTLAAFATMRTGANLALQGLATVTGPMMPEMVRFLRERKSDRIDAVFCSLWIPITILICPAITLLQLFVAPFFSAWTRGKVQFDPLLFALLSSSVLFSALSQPAASILTGNNLIRDQLKISIISSSVILISVFLGVPKIGMTAAAIALLLGEITAFICNEWVARQWFRKNGLVWPKRILWYLLPVTSITMVGLIIIALIATSEHRSDYRSIQFFAIITIFVSSCISSFGLYLKIPILLRSRINPFLKIRGTQQNRTV
ncbi:polysaccharide biosynthesis C-terminal domain-containing protein [bacterium]|nr:polysaccharide biosynthesis C-terminal domain-containing protein [bacterium]